LCMRRQYQINHRTRNTQFNRQELITRLGNNRVSTIASFFKTREGEVEWQYRLAMVDENDREQ
jgi:hypothetical protein